MELFPSMTYRDVMEMPYKDFKLLHQIRINRKLKEQREADSQRKEMEKKNKEATAKAAIVRSK